MAIAPLNPRRSVELAEDHLMIRDLPVAGSVFEAAKAAAAHGDELDRLVETALEIGGTALLQGQNRATIESVTDEIDRLIKETGRATEQMPVEVEAKLKGNLDKLAELLAENFDPARKNAVQHQIKDMIDATTASRIKALTDDLLDEQHGPLARLLNERVLDRVKQIERTLASHTETNQALLANVVSIVERAGAKEQLNEAHQRSTHKGASFEDIVFAELDAMFGRLGDDVHDSRYERGSDNRLKCVGDYVVTINPKETRGRRVAFVVEAKSGPKNHTQAHDELDRAIRNRDAGAGVIVFDGVADAPLAGRRYGPYPGGKYIAVLDPAEGNTLAFEVACLQARMTAIAGVEDNDAVDAAWLVEQCDQLTTLIDAASAIKRGVNDSKRGLVKVEASYDRLCSQAHAVLDAVRARLTDAGR
jgi:hypothetical protein